MHTKYEIFVEGRLIACAWAFPNQLYAGCKRVSVTLHDFVNLLVEGATSADFKDSIPENNAIEELLATMSIEPWKCTIIKKQDWADP